MKRDLSKIPPEELTPNQAKRELDRLAQENAYHHNLY